MTAASFVVLPFLVIGTRRLTLMHKRLADEMGRHLPVVQAPLPFHLPLMQESSSITSRESVTKG